MTISTLQLLRNVHQRGDHPHPAIDHLLTHGYSLKRACGAVQPPPDENQRLQRFVVRVVNQLETGARKRRLDPAKILLSAAMLIESKEAVCQLDAHVIDNGPYTYDVYGKVPTATRATLLHMGNHVYIGVVRWPRLKAAFGGSVRDMNLSMNTLRKRVETAQTLYAAGARNVLRFPDHRFDHIIKIVNAQRERG